MSNKEEILNDFQIRNIQLLTHLLVNDAISDEIVENIRKSELDYFVLLDKYKLLEQKANIDEKTNLLKYKDDYLTDIIKTASRIYFDSNDMEYHVSMIRFDIDDFSIFNNKYGHDIGDKVLIKIADLIKTNSRPTDYAIRFGGEEFDVILPSTDLDGATKYLDKLFEKIRETEIDHNGEKLKVTISAGVSFMTYMFDHKKVNEDKVKKYFQTLQIEADSALYEAKYLGKDQYCFYSEDKKDKYIEIRDKYSQK